MKTYKYLIKHLDVTVTLQAKGPNSSGKIIYEGENREFVMLKLSSTYGAFGHGFNAKGDTPIDLDCALISTFGNDNIEVLGEIIESYDPEIPEGAMT